MNDPIISSLQNYCTTLQGCIQAIYNLIVAFAVVLAFLMFLIGAFKNMLSVIPDIKMEGKRQMRNALIGLGVIFASGILLYWINPEIFNPKLIIYRVQFSYPQIIASGFQEVKKIIETGRALPLRLEGRGGRCENFFKAIDELVEAGVGNKIIFDLTKYKLEGRNLTKDEVKMFLKALLVTEAASGCYPRPNRYEYSFATFGIEYVSEAEGLDTRKGHRSAYQKIVNEALGVYTSIINEIPDLKNKFNLSPRDFTIENLAVGKPLDNPYLISAVVIKRLWRYEEHLNKMGLGAYSQDLIAVLLRYKVGSGERLNDYINNKTITHQDAANIIVTIRRIRSTA